MGGHHAGTSLKTALIFHKERESQGEQSFLQNVSGKALIT